MKISWNEHKYSTIDSKWVISITLPCIYAGASYTIEMKLNFRKLKWNELKSKQNRMTWSIYKLKLAIDERKIENIVKWVREWEWKKERGREEDRERAREREGGGGVETGEHINRNCVCGFCLYGITLFQIHTAYRYLWNYMLTYWRIEFKMPKRRWSIREWNRYISFE